MQEIETASVAFGPQLYGYPVSINTCPTVVIGPVAIDVETDEKDNFVGIACFDGRELHYYTDLKKAVDQNCLDCSQLIGHNLKGDIKWLMNWGVEFKSDQLLYDTCLASYVHDTTKKSHGLKDLAKEYLQMTWPTYKEMVGKGRTKQTLDKQEVGRVAAYCGMDCLATYRLYEYFQKKLTAQEKRYLETIELPTARALLDIELKGAEIDVAYLCQLKEQFEKKLSYLEAALKAQRPGVEYNINSNRQTAELLEMQGAVLPITPKGNKKVDKGTLQQWKQLPAVPFLLEYSKYEKLLSTYVMPLLEKKIHGRIYCSFNQISKGTKGEDLGISTGRLSSSNPNLQNIPTRTEEGELIRKVFIAPKEKVLIDADYSQIEPRLVAHFSKDPLFIKAFTENRDIYQELVEGTGRDRNDGKTFMLALLYGAQPSKLASIFKSTEQEAQVIIDRIMKKLPGVTAWINRTKFEARQKKGVFTLFKRWIPLPGIQSSNYYERLHWERAAVNYVIQGSAAEVMKLSLIKLREGGLTPSLTVHDEILVEIETQGDIESQVSSNIKRIMESVVQLDVPLKVEVGAGKNWQEAKS